MNHAGYGLVFIALICGSLPCAAGQNGPSTEAYCAELSSGMARIRERVRLLTPLDGREALIQLSANGLMTTIPVFFAQGPSGEQQIFAERDRYNEMAASIKRQSCNADMRRTVVSWQLARAATAP